MFSSVMCGDGWGDRKANDGAQRLRLFIIFFTCNFIFLYILSFNFRISFSLDQQFTLKYFRIRVKNIQRFFFIGLAVFWVMIYKHSLIFLPHDSTGTIIILLSSQN